MMISSLQPHERGESSSPKIKCGPTGMKEITCVSSEGRRRVVEYNQLGQPIGQDATKLKIFIETTIRFHVPITHSSWPAVP